MLDRLGRVIQIGDIVASDFDFGTSYCVLDLDDKYIILKRAYRGRKSVRLLLRDYLWYIWS